MNDTVEAIINFKAKSSTNGINNLKESTVEKINKYYAVFRSEFFDEEKNAFTREARQRKNMQPLNAYADLALYKSQIEISGIDGLSAEQAQYQYNLSQSLLEEAESIKKIQGKHLNALQITKKKINQANEYPELHIEYQAKKNISNQLSF
ncbi:MAG: hypothetical protein PQ612_03130 [Rickettsiales bacterium]|nr:hypothetical protein [Pseudomonadota bacterium]MDA0965895.1 hypothetical protein [Pseudomonadota bacterium]MDG4542635.1 hypothetical protein [Rickettsiales bacterium]MDG4545139.1 hypothetical protein [Rickettsiales bacterium]MDG4547262.1 hypothetical protein [Rickettsiales bacterium]